MGEQGVWTQVTLTCQRCGASTNDESDDPAFDGERAIEDNSWGYGDPGMELCCDECLSKEGT